jgi:ATP-dependent 26S proteasome regulatory subunit
MNTGVVVLATTNHPERLDPAILDRPSRFDRKYYFELPAQAERRAYVSAWSAKLQHEMRISEDFVTELVSQTEGFSFAYMKELFLSSMMQWMAASEPKSIEAIMADRVARLRGQMSSMVDEPDTTSDDDSDEDED